VLYLCVGHCCVSPQQHQSSVTIIAGSCIGLFALFFNYLLFFLLSNMFFATSECALFSRKPRRVLEHFWWTSQWLQGLATYTDQVRASKFLLAILCPRQWHRNFFFFFTAVHYEQNRLLYSPWFLYWAELLLVTGIHPDHCASTVSHSSFESLWI
jgi:hypothetical protein